MPNEYSDALSQEEALTIIARSLAFLCLHATGLWGKGLLPQAELLDGLGLSRAEAAKMLNTSTDSLKVMRNRAKRKAGGKRAKKRAAAK